MRKLLIGLIAMLASSFSLAFAGNADVGSKADLAAVRAAEHRAAPQDSIGGVHVYGNYALVQWYGNPEGSGPAAFRRVNGAWKRVYFDGGVTTLDILAQHGIPKSAGRVLCTGWMKATGSTPCLGFK